MLLLPGEKANSPTTAPDSTRCGASIANRSPANSPACSTALPNFRGPWATTPSVGLRVVDTAYAHANIRFGHRQSVRNAIDAAGLGRRGLDAREGPSLRT